MSDRQPCPGKPPDLPRRDAIADHPGIVVVDAHVFRRNCLVELIRRELPDVAVVGAGRAHDVDHAPRLDVRLAVVIVDDEPPAEGEVAALLGALRRMLPRAALVLLSADHGEAEVAHSTRWGVARVISGRLPIAMILSGLRHALAEGPVLPVAPSSNGAAARAEPSAGVNGVPGTARFTPRQAQVLAALQKGQPNKVIARELGVSENTVKLYVHQIMRKLRATNRTEAVLLSREHASGDGKPAPRS